MNVIWMDLYRFIHYTKMFYYLRCLNLITHKVLSVGVEIAVSPLLSREQLGHLYSDLYRKMIQTVQDLQRVRSY